MRLRLLRHLGFCVVLLVTFTQCCSDSFVVIAPPNERYDHNRDRIMGKWTYTRSGQEKTVDIAQLSRDKTLAMPPPAYVLRGGGRGADGLPAARLLPVYSGLALPLSNVGTEDEPSDREDLLDYLASGPTAKVGLQPRSMAGGLGSETEERFGPVLELLASALDQTALLAWAKNGNVKVSFNIVDPRFDRTGFSRRIAFVWRDFWFVCFQLRGRQHFSRLVVTPIAPSSQDFDGKKPTREDG